MSNYPDNIRDFDHDPRSPFYVEQHTHCDKCEKKLAEDDDFISHEDHGFCSSECCDDFIKDLDNE
jgi:hypothetical protein